MGWMLCKRESENHDKFNATVFFGFSGDEAEAIRLLELGYSASTPDQYGRTPMHFAADQGSVKISCIIFMNQCKLLICFLFVYSGFIKVMKLLIEKGYKDQIHSKTTFNNLPINYAVQKRKSKIQQKSVGVHMDRGWLAG